MYVHELTYVDVYICWHTDTHVVVHWRYVLKWYTTPWPLCCLQFILLILFLLFVLILLVFIYLYIYRITAFQFSYVKFGHIIDLYRKSMRGRISHQVLFYRTFMQHQCGDQMPTLITERMQSYMKLPCPMSCSGFILMALFIILKGRYI